MKKIIFVFLLVCALCFSACNNQIEGFVYDNMSDLRTNFFMGAGKGVYAELSSGVREQQFYYDGISTQKVECAVLSISFDLPKAINAIHATVQINDNAQQIVLYHSPYDEQFMADLGQKIDNNATIIITVDEQCLELKNVSNAWQIDYKKAINIGITEFESKLESLYFNGKLNAEGYLKIIYEREFNKAYWYFAIIDRAGNRYSLIVDVNTGRVLEN